MPFNDDYIELNNIIAATYLGITPEEQSIKQDILINIKLYKDLKSSAVSDKIEDTINYSDVINYLYYELAKIKFNLIESLAEYLVSSLADVFNPYAIELDISKTNPPLDYYPDSKITIHIYRKFKEG
ncbi:MAG: hypothetical protein CMP22_06635 [Rickettsiales bacterium]|nr:hypothetical protein [Rickettsiales bacterium]|tara:strand:- start:510 stop:890 length:381 start_codon:yes stop_codon:yes gene_type:complete